MSCCKKNTSSINSMSSVISWLPHYTPSPNGRATRTLTELSQVPWKWPNPSQCIRCTNNFRQWTVQPKYWTHFREVNSTGTWSYWSSVLSSSQRRSTAITMSSLTWPFTMVTQNTNLNMDLLTGTPGADGSRHSCSTSWCTLAKNSWSTWSLLELPWLSTSPTQLYHSALMVTGRSHTSHSVAASACTSMFASTLVTSQLLFRWQPFEMVEQNESIA